MALKKETVPPLRAAWNKLHSLECNISYFIDERKSRPETVNAKHAWDMILFHIHRELVDVKDLLSEVPVFDSK